MILNGKGLRLSARSPEPRDSDSNLEFNSKYNSVNRTPIYRMRNSGCGPGQANKIFFWVFLNSAKLVKVVLDEYNRLLFVWKARIAKIFLGTYKRFSEILRRQTSIAGFWWHFQVAGYSWHPPFETNRVFTQILT